MPVASRIRRGWLRKASMNGILEIPARATSFLNTGVSSIFSRIHRPIATSMTLARNGMRQPQDTNAASGMNRAVSRNVMFARMIAPPPPRLGNIAQTPRRDFGAFSDPNSTPPAYSPPAARPCRIRSATTRIGAATPI